jgi:type IV secretion system protein TrbL
MGVCSVPVISTVCHVAGKAAGTVISAPFDWLAEGVGNAAEWMFKGVWQLFDSTTLVGVTDPNYLKVYDVLFGVAIFLMLLFFFLQLATGLIQRDPGALHRAAIGLAKSVLGSFLVVTLTGLALTIVDELCVGIIQATGNTLDEMGGKIAALAAGIGAISLSAPGAGAVIIIFLGCLAITGAAIVWFSLLIRKALLLVAVVLAPVALSGQSWDHARGWFTKWASFVALIVSKLVVVVIFLVAINQMNAPLNLDLSSISNPVAGIVLMFVAAFAPYMAYKFISFIGFDLYHAMSAESEAKGAMNRPIPVPSMPGLSNARKVLGGDSGSGGGSAGSGGGDGGSTPPGGGGGGKPAGGGGTGGTAGGEAAGGAEGAAAGPEGMAVVAGAQAVTAAAKAAPATGQAVARSAVGHADAGQEAAGQQPPETSRESGGSGRSAPVPVPPAQTTPGRSRDRSATGTEPGRTIDKRGSDPALRTDDDSAGIG